MEEKAIELIENLANQLGVAVPYLWEVLVKQAYVSAVSTTLFTGLALIVLIVASILLLRGIQREPSEFDLAAVYFWGIVFSAIISIVGIFKFVFVVPTAWLNPEYWALKQIINMM